MTSWACPSRVASWRRFAWPRSPSRVKWDRLIGEMARGGFHATILRDIPRLSWPIARCSPVLDIVKADTIVGIALPRHTRRLSVQATVVNDNKHGGHRACADGCQRIRIGRLVPTYFLLLLLQTDCPLGGRGAFAPKRPSAFPTDPISDRSGNPMHTHPTCPFLSHAHVLYNLFISGLV